MAETDPPSQHLINRDTGRLIVDQALDYAIITLTLDGRILTWNPGAARIFGYTEGEALGLHFGTIFTSSDLAAGEERMELEFAWRDGRVEDSRWHLRRDGSRFWGNGVAMAIRTEGQPMIVKVLRDETKNRLAEEQRILLLNELNHRINNTLVTVQSLVEQTLRSSDVDRSVREDLTARLMALSQAHGVLVEQNWAGAELSDLVTRALAPYHDDVPDRIRCAGPSLRLSPQQAVSFSLVLHELATNAVKYGALSAHGGQVSVSWNESLDNQGARHMTFLWAERGGPQVTPPSRKGFGSRLLAQSFDREGGETHVEFAPEGVSCTIRLTLSSEAELPTLNLAVAKDRSWG